MSSRLSDVASRRTILPAGASVVDTLTAANVLLNGPTGVIAVQTDDGVERDLTWVPDAETEVALIQRDSPAGLAIIRHSTTHIMAQAVQNLFPSTRLAIGPPTAEGFYYDFLSDRNFTPDDLVALEEEMRRLVADGQLFRRRVLTSLADAEAESAQEPLKQELIATHPVPWRFEGDPYGDDALSYYDNLSYDGERKWTDLCRGPHVLDTKYLGVFTLTHAAAAYWRGDEKREQLQRIYGTAFLDRKALKTYLTEREERLKRDHRKLGEELDLFTFDPHIGRGLPLWLPSGTIIRDELEKWARETERSLGYKRVVTPALAKEDLYYLSGHLPYYTDDMYAPISIEDETYYLRPMNCPHHHMVYRARPKSYRDLPYKVGEYGTVYRFEKSGQLQGLMRTRGFTQNDAHIYCTDEQAEEQFLEVMRMHEMYYQQLGITDFHMVLAVRDPANTDKYHDDEEMWTRAEAITRGAMEKSGIPFILDVGGAAHYGPKIDFIIRSVTGREFAASTNQVDLYTPKQFGLTYKASDGTEKTPIVIHRAPLGSHERFVSFLTEQYGGAFPFWLAPEQIVVVPVTDTFDEGAQAVADELYAAGLRAEADVSDARMQAKIRTHSMRKVPVTIVVGARELEERTASVRLRTGGSWTAPLDEVKDYLLTVARDRRLVLDTP